MLFPCSYAVTKVQELFYGCGAETVDGTHLTVELFHQVEGASLIGMDQHAVKHQLLFGREETKQALQAGDMIPQKQIDMEFRVVCTRISMQNLRRF